MLAQTILSPDALSLTEKQHGALVAVLGMLEREEMRDGRVTSNDRMRGWWAAGRIQHLDGFNMHVKVATIKGRPECGTVGCIAGWACHIANDYDLFLVPRYDHHAETALNNLFCPYWGSNAWKASRAQAAAALRLYLSTGKDGNACWNEALQQVTS